MYRVTVLEAEVRVPPRLAPLGAGRDALCQAPPLAIFSIPYFIEAPPNLSLHLHMTFSLSTHLISLPNFPFLEGHQSYGIRAHPNNLTLTNHSREDPVSK